MYGWCLNNHQLDPFELLFKCAPVLFIWEQLYIHMCAYMLSTAVYLLLMARSHSNPSTHSNRRFSFPFHSSRQLNNLTYLFKHTMYIRLGACLSIHQREIKKTIKRSICVLFSILQSYQAKKLDIYMTSTYIMDCIAFIIWRRYTLYSHIIKSFICSTRKKKQKLLSSWKPKGFLTSFVSIIDDRKDCVTTFL